MQNRYLRNQKNEEEQQNSEHAGQCTPHLWEMQHLAVGTLWLLTTLSSSEGTGEEGGEVFPLYQKRNRVLIKNGHKQVESL